MTTYDWELLVPARPLAQRLKLVHLEVQMMALDRKEECQTPPWMWPHHCGHCAVLLSQPFVSGEELPLAEVEVPLRVGESDRDTCCTGCVMFILAPPAPLATCDATVGTRVDIALAQIMVVMH